MLESGMILLTISSTMTSLVTEAIKKTLSVDKTKVSLNILAAVVSVICSLFVSFGYIIFTNVPFNVQIIFYILSLTVLTWLTATLGYDKIRDSLRQIANLKKTQE